MHRQEGTSDPFGLSFWPGLDTPLVLTLDRHQPLHFIGVGGIGMSAIAGILADRGYSISGSDPRDNAVLQDLRSRGVRVFREQSAATIDAIRSGTSCPPAVVVSSAVPASNPELVEAERAGLQTWHRSDVLAALIAAQPSISVAGSHGKTTTSSLITTLLREAGQDPTAVIGGIVPSLGSNGHSGQGKLLVAEADESDGSLVKFKAEVAVITNLELDHTDHYADLNDLIATMKRFSQGCRQLLANHDDPVLRKHFDASAWWSVDHVEGVDYAAVPAVLDGDRTEAEFYENGSLIGRITVPMPGLHNLSNVTAALAACRMQGLPLAALQKGLSLLQAPDRRFDFRGTWKGRQIVDDYAHHPSEVLATLTMARLMVSSGRSPLPQPPKRLMVVFQPHRYSRTQEFLGAFAEALSHADCVALAPIYAAGEAPINGVNSHALAERLQRLIPDRLVLVAETMDHLNDLVQEHSQPDDLVLAMGAGDVNSLWSRLRSADTSRPSPLAA